MTKRLHDMEFAQSTALQSCSFKGLMGLSFRGSQCGAAEDPSPIATGPAPHTG
jgi:hypothetical protein